MSKTWKDILKPLEVELRSLRPFSTSGFDGEPYVLYSLDHLIDVKWGDYQATIGDIQYEAEYNYGVYVKSWVVLSYEFDLYNEDCAIISQRFLQKVLGVTEDEEYLEEQVMPLIFTYIFVDILGLKYKGDSETFILNTKIAGNKTEYDFETFDIEEIDEIKLMPYLFKKLKGKKITESDVYHLISKIYTGTVFTIDIPVANALARFWATVASKILQKLSEIAKWN